mgnify:CR=1 FL=1
MTEQMIFGELATLERSQLADKCIVDVRPCSVPPQLGGNPRMTGQSPNFRMLRLV